MISLRTQVRAYTAASGSIDGEGVRVLAGQADRVELLGVDRWIGGTHATAENLWRWDPAARAAVR